MDWQTMPDSEISHLFERVRVYRAGAFPAPYKPLVLLRSLARLANGEERLELFGPSEMAVKTVITKLSLPAIPRAVYPFWRLQNDRIWEVLPLAELKKHENRSGDVTREVLLKNGARGGFPGALHQRFERNPALFSDVVQILLNKGEFPAAVRAHVLMTVGATY